MHQPANHTTPSDGAASLLVAALEHTWQTIRTRHPEVPDAVLVVASGSEGKRLNLGHFAPHRWQVHGTDRHEVLVGGEGLHRGPVDVLGTLLHEAAHGLACKPEHPGHQPPGPLPQPPLRHPRPRTRPGGHQRQADRLVGHHRPRADRERLRRPARGPGRGAGAVAPPGAPHRPRHPLAQPARRRLRLRPAHPGRQDDPRGGAHRLRRLPATLPTRRHRPSQQLTLNRQ